MKGNIAALVEEIDKYSGNQLKRKEDLRELIILSYSGYNEKLIEELSFNSKYVQGLFRILKHDISNPGVKNLALIKSDISTNLKKVREKIEQILLNSDEETKQYFRDNYLRLSQDNLLNLIELINDLEWTKKYLNHLKREHLN